MNEAVKSTLDFQAYLPYIVSILCSIVSGVASYLVARREAKSDINKLEKQFSLDLEKERELFKMEKEKMEIEHKYQMELKQKELEGALGSSIMSSLMAEVMKNSEVQKQLRSNITTAGQQNRKKGK